MLKIIPHGSFDFGMPTATLLKIWSRGPDRDFMQKRAAIMDSHIAGIRPEKGKSFIHLISLGSAEYFGFNRNGDGFNEKAAQVTFAEPRKGIAKTAMLADGLVKHHSTFIKSGGHVFKHHKNQDPKYSIGDVVAEAYNPEMHRGELIAKVSNDHPDWYSEIQGLAKGKDIPFSMSCKIARDLCNWCGNRARSRMDYCDHLRYHMGEILKSGHQVGAWNDDPFFFDISKVHRPADRIAWSFRKVANSLAALGGAALADEAGLILPNWVYDEQATVLSKYYQKKMAGARKMAEIEKVVDGLARGEDNSHLSAMCGACPPDIPSGEMEKLRKMKLMDALEGLGSAQICLSLRDFFRLVMNEKFNDVEPDLNDAEDMLPDLFNRLQEGGGLHECASDGAYDPTEDAVPMSVRNIAERLLGSHSLMPGPAKRRMTITIIRGGSMPEKRARYSGQSKRADYLAKEYAKYLLSYGLHVAGNDEGRELTVLRHRFRF
jgi:hypothetical protein